MLSGTGYAFLAGYAAKIVLARLYPVEAFGIFDLILTLVGILTPVASLRYEDALMLPKDAREGGHSFVLASGLVIVISSALWLFLPFRSEIARLYNSVALETWLWTVPIVLMINRLAKIMELWLSRHEAFGLISTGQVTYSTSMLGFRIGVGLFSSSPAGLIFGLVTGQSMALILYARRVAITLKSALSGGLSLQILRHVARRYRRFPTYTMPAAVIGALLTRMPFLLIPYYFSLKTLGHFGWAFSVLFIPLSLLGGSIAQVFFVRAVEARREGRLSHVTDTIHKRLVMLTLFPSLILMAAGPEIYSFLFGAEKWLQSGIMVSYIAPWILVTAVASPLTRLFDVLERQRLELVTNLAMFVVLTASLVVGGRTGNLLTTLTLLSVFGTIVRLVQIVILLRLGGVSTSLMLRPYWYYGRICVPIVLLVAGLSRWLTNVETTLLAGFSGLIYLGFIVWNENLLLPKTEEDNG
jgi:lipopolysaccharide exporter